MIIYLYMENYKTLMEGVKDTNKGKDISPQGLKKVLLFKFSYYIKIQCYIYQTSNGIFHRDFNYSNNYIQPKGLHGQSNLGQMIKSSKYQYPMM